MDAVADEVGADAIAVDVGAVVVVGDVLYPGCTDAWVIHPAVGTLWPET